MTVYVFFLLFVWIFNPVSDSMQCCVNYDRMCNTMTVCVFVIFFIVPSLYEVYQVLMPNHDVW